MGKPSGGAVRVPRARNDVCPHCGRLWARGLKVSGSRRQMIVEVLSNYPDGLSSERLMDIVYADDPDGGPDIRCLYVLKMLANKELAPQGWKIVSDLGRGAKYHLVKVDR